MDQKCLLCRRWPDFRGVFEPNDPQAYGAPAGKRRLFFYNLCFKCSRKASTPGRVEEALMGMAVPNRN